MTHHPIVDPSWNKRVLQFAKDYGKLSRDRSTQVGCVIVRNQSIIAMGYNQFPAGVDESPDCRHERPAKYKFTEHAERQAIYDAAKRGVALEGTVMHLPWYPCADCARALIQSGVKELVCYSPDWDNLDPKWADDFQAASIMLYEAGVIVTYEVP